MSSVDRTFWEIGQAERTDPVQMTPEDDTE